MTSLGGDHSQIVQRRAMRAIGANTQEKAATSEIDIAGCLEMQERLEESQQDNTFTHQRNETDIVPQVRLLFRGSGQSDGSLEAGQH